jgi:hypothetical protein
MDNETGIRKCSHCGRYGFYVLQYGEGFRCNHCEKINEEMGVSGELKKVGAGIYTAPVELIQQGENNGRDYRNNLSHVKDNPDC